MDPLTTGLLIGGSVAAPLLGGYLGGKKAEGARSTADEYQQKALDQLMNLPDAPQYDTSSVSMPDYIEPGALEAILPDYGIVPEYSPEMLTAQSLGPSEMAGISTDPDIRRAQMQALQRMQEVGQDGMTAEDEFRMAQMQADIGARQRGAREALQQQMQARGIAGSGLELAAQLQNQQAMAQQENLRGLGLQAQAEQRALDAMMQGGQLAGQMRGQEFNEASAKAQAADAIARFNAQQAAATQAANVGAKNAAAMNAQNLALQRAKDEAAALQQHQMNEFQRQQYLNQQRQQDYQNRLGEQARLNTLKSQAYQDALGKAKGVTSGYGQAADYYGGRGQQEAQKYTGLGSAIGSGLESVLKYGDK